MSDDSTLLMPSKAHRRWKYVRFSRLRVLTEVVPGYYFVTDSKGPLEAKLLPGAISMEQRLKQRKFVD
jgi:hypothetical protein